MGFDLSRARLARAWEQLRAIAAVTVFAGLSACGGGGGGSDGPSAPVTVSASSVTLADSYEDDQSPPIQTLTLQVSGTGIAAVGIAFDPAYPEETWLGAEMTGAASPYQVSIGLSGPAPVGEHTAHLLAGAVDKDGNVLDSTSITVNYKVIARLRSQTSGLDFQGVNGAAPPGTGLIEVSGTALAWTASSPDSWIHLSGASGNGDGQIGVDVDDSGLASGTHSGSVVITSTDGQTVTVPVSFTLTSTSLTVSSTSLAFGGASGRDSSAQTLDLSLGTDGNAYSWEIQSLPAWLAASETTGTVSGTPQRITLTPDLAKVSAGSYSTTMSLVAHVNGDLVTQQISLSLNVDDHRLYLTEDGVAFTSTPAWSRLTRAVVVKDNFGRATPWTATSDKPWLSVTSSGTAGGSLSLSANPASLSADSVSIATVTVKSSEAGVSPVTMKVGLWKASATPSSVATNTSVPYTRMVADRIRPYVYVHSGGTSIDVYNPYTNTKVATIANVGNALGAMAVGTNGQSLYVVDAGFKRIAVVDLNTRTKTRVINATQPTQSDFKLLATRVSGVELLLGGDRTVYRVSDGAQVGTGDGPLDHITAAPGGERMYDLVANLSPAGAGAYATDYTAVGGGRFLSTFIGGGEAGSNGKDIAVSMDGATVYTASGSPYSFSSFSGSDMSAIGSLPGAEPYPNCIEVGSDGRIAGGLDGIYSTYDIWLYSKAGAIINRYKVVGYAAGLRDGQLRFTGDALMLATLSDDGRMVFIPIGP